MSEGYTVGSGVSGNAHYPRALAGQAYGATGVAWGWWLWLLLGIVSGGIGLLPWLLTGMALPLQNLWASDAGASDMPTALLPLTQYRLGTVVALIVVGSAVAGILARAAHRHWSAGGFWALVAGVVLVQGAAAVQSAAVVADGLRGGIASIAYLAVLLLVALVSMLVGVAVLTLIARAPRAGALIGIALVAYPFAQWAAGFAVQYTPSGLGWVVTDIVVWTPALVVALAIIWCGVGTFGRVIAAIIALLLLWAAPALNTAVGAATGSRVLARSPSDMIDYGAAVFRSALFELGPVLYPVGAAIVVTVVGLIVRGLVTRARRRNAPQQYGRADADYPFDETGAFDADAARTAPMDTVPLDAATRQPDSATQPLDV